MNSREIIENTAALKPVDRPAVALLSAGAWAFNTNGLSLEKALRVPPEELADILAQAYSLAGSDLAWVGSGYNNLLIKAIGGKIKFRSKGTPDVTEPLFSKASDVDAIDLSVLKADEDLNVLFETTRHLSNKIGSHKLVGGSSWGPFTLSGLLFGAEQLMRFVYKDKEALRHIMEFSTRLYLEYIRLYIENGAAVAFLAEPTSSGDMVSRKHFSDFVLPYLKDIFTKINQPGIVTGIHICGNTENILDLIPETGAHIMSVDYKVSLEKADAIFGGKMALAGNMNPVGVIQQSTPDEVLDACLACRRQVRPESSYIVMPGCDIPPSTPLANIQAMSISVFLTL